ncbi:glycoside hydrolase family 28 protein [Myriangium duriaei CBS 260.36]|uniref:Glycoside hydrolase family 28 protein n=1 Tax=Myriangium duriaei CBS 260.36 TaxID=1168546 RepID=A0A9P4MHT2_9PEZI|nr:glycoside hydrolase family 28 protein [Myriangium duriaei CBS 260.36]
MRSFPTLFAAAGLLISLVEAQLSGPVGPLTTVAQKMKVKECSVLNYGGKADGTTDIGPAITAAFNACKTGGVVVIPSGNYAMATWVTLSGGNAWALQFDGIITRTGTGGGNMIMIEHSTDFELFSSAAAGAVQGNGYIFHKQNNYSSGPRLLRMYEVTDFSVHDIALVDSPSFHFSMQTCTNGEVYNMAIRGGNHGALDGIDVWSNNIHIHDVMVTNKDECVTVKSPAKNILVENVHCNWSGGCSFGSLGADTAISDIVYRNIYTIQSNNMLMIKSNGGSGYVSDVLFDNFIGHNNAYNLDIDQYWSDLATQPGDGVQLNNITFSNWAAKTVAGSSRPPVRFNCADGAPCTDMFLKSVQLLTEAGDQTAHFCRSAYGNGRCLKVGDGGSYPGVSTTISTVTTASPTATMGNDLKTHFDSTLSIPIPTIAYRFGQGVVRCCGCGNDHYPCYLCCG